MCWVALPTLHRVFRGHVERSGAVVHSLQRVSAVSHHIGTPPHCQNTDSKHTPVTLWLWLPSACVSSVSLVVWFVSRRCLTRNRVSAVYRRTHVHVWQCFSVCRRVVSDSLSLLCMRVCVSACVCVCVLLTVDRGSMFCSSDAPRQWTPWLDCLPRWCGSSRVL